MNREELYRKFGPQLLEALVLMQRERDKVLISKINEIANVLNLQPIKEITEENINKILDKRHSRIKNYKWMDEQFK